MAPTPAGRSGTRPTTWFFETFLLAAHLPGYTPADSRWLPVQFLLRTPSAAASPSERGLLSRPVIAEVNRMAPAGGIAAWKALLEAGFGKGIGPRGRTPAGAVETGAAA